MPGDRRKALCCQISVPEPPKELLCPDLCEIYPEECNPDLWYSDEVWEEEGQPNLSKRNGISRPWEYKLNVMLEERQGELP